VLKGAAVNNANKKDLSIRGRVVSFPESSISLS